MKITDQISAPDRNTVLIDSNGKPTELFADWMEHISNKLNLISVGTATPEGQITAGIGSVFLRLDGGANTTLYVKEANTDDTGWAAI